MEHAKRLTLEADGSSTLHFSRDDLESVANGQARADHLLVQKTRELMAQNGEDDFAKAFTRVAELNPSMYELYRFGGR
jgi:hypothetical protein